MKSHKKEPKRRWVSLCCNASNTTRDWGNEERCDIYTRCEKCKQKCELKQIEVKQDGETL